MQSSAGVRIGKDAIVVLALIGTLGLVCAVDLMFAPAGGEAGEDQRASNGVTLSKPEVKEQVQVSETSQPKPLRLAVTPPKFDDMGALLGKLGEGYRFDSILLDDLLDLEKIRAYDVIFFTCGTVPDSWLGERIGEGARDSEVFRPNPEVLQKLTKSLRSYVQQGGTLYASDWRFSIVQMAFHESADTDRGDAEGAVQEVQAEIVDSGLQEALKRKSIPLHFDKPGWHPASFRGESVTTYLRGTFKTMDGKDLTKPLLVRIRFGEGQIFYTAFHNETQNSEEELQLLRYLVFAMVTSRVESKVHETLVKGGFSKQKQSLLSTSASDPTAIMTHRCEKAGPLVFVLAFEDRGALLHLTVEGPDDRKFEKEGTSTLRVDVPDAKPGDWKCSITAKRLPFDNFPFKFTVGEK